MFFTSRLRQQLSEMESANEPSIMETIEKNSARQQQAIRQVRQTDLHLDLL